MGNGRGDAPPRSSSSCVRISASTGFPFSVVMPRDQLNRTSPPFVKICTASSMVGAENTRVVQCRGQIWSAAKCHQGLSCGAGRVNNCAGVGAHRIARHARPRRCEKDFRASRAMSGYDRRSSRDGGRVSGFSDGYGARESDRGAGRDEPRASRYDDRGRNDDGYGYGRGGDDHGRSPYPPPPDARGPPAPLSLIHISEPTRPY